MKPLSLNERGSTIFQPYILLFTHLQRNYSRSGGRVPYPSCITNLASFLSRSLRRETQSTGLTGRSGVFQFHNSKRRVPDLDRLKLTVPIVIFLTQDSIVGG